jgi:glutathione reductase (NADPH)
MPSRTFDLVVIGSGAGAGSVASRCRAAGWSVAMIDKQPFGGTCPLRGCDPKKVLVGAAAAVDSARLLDGKGVRPSGLAIDWAQLMRFKRTFTDPYPEEREATLTKSGVETFHGAARFTAPSQIVVGGIGLQAARAIVVATGARPADLEISGREHLTASDRFLELPALPGSLVFVGGGYISFEFAHVAARAGARVSVLHRRLRPLEGFDPDLVDRLVVRTRALGVDVRLETEVRAIEAIGTGRRVRFSDGRGGGTLDAECAVHGAGRVADLDGLDLDAGNVRFSRAGIEVNEFLQSVSNPLVYAAGDCAATDAPALTPVAGYESRIVAANLLEGRRAAVRYEAVPSVVFTVPPLARVGLGVAEARQRGLRFSDRLEDTSSWYSSRRVGEGASASRVLVEEGTGRILGAHLLGPCADETINLFTLAIRAGLTKRQFRDVLWAYPTHASDTPHMM